jgi:O-glycosyl hydrolase
MTTRILALVAVVVVFSGARPAFAQQPAPFSHVTINPNQRFQVIDGFGVNFNGTYFRDAQKPMVDMLIDDLGATIFRLDPYGQTDWEVTNDNDDSRVMSWVYYNDRYSIPAFEASWAAARYFNSRGIRPFMTLSGTVPGWMLDDKAPPPKHGVCNDKANPHHPRTARPAHLNSTMYEEFAETVVSMAVYARTKARIDFEYFSPLNEPDCYPVEGPRVDPDEAPRLLDAVARRMREEGLGDVKLVVIDQSNETNDYFGPILEDSKLMKGISVFSVHSYGNRAIAPQVENIRKSKYPDRRVWLTEYGDLNHLDFSPENEWKGFCITASKRALRALNQGASAALFWDAYDNYHEHDARLTYYGLVHNSDHVYRPKKRYYAARQLYRFVRPGSQRIAAGSDAPGLMVSAYRDATANSIVLVGVKEGGHNRIQVALSDGGRLPAAWEVYLTTPTLDCQRVDTVAVHEGVAEIEMPDEAIFTLVGQSK